MPRILIVDDDEDLLLSQRMFLESRGYEVATAANADEAIRSIQTQKPDLILADLMMEHFDSGFVFCKRAREQEGMANVPILMQTAASKKVGFSFDASSEADKRWMKVDEVLTKPVPLEHLHGKIKQYLSRKP